MDMTKAINITTIIELNTFKSTFVSNVIARAFASCWFAEGGAAERSGSEKIRGSSQDFPAHAMSSLY